MSRAAQRPMADLIIFDCDGVLIDSEVIACRIDAEVLSEAGIPISAAEIAQRFIGTTMSQMLATLSEEHEVALPDDLVARLQARLETAFAQELRPLPGTAELLAALTVPSCVASSSGPERLAQSLGLTGLADHFGARVFSARSVARGKPAPDLFLYAAERMAVEPDHCLVVEDSLSGVTAAVAAGMAVTGFTGGSHCGSGHGERLRAAGAVQVVANMADLGELIGL